MTVWLRRHHYIEDKPLEARSNEMSSPGAIEACADIAMQRGVFAAVSGHDGDAHATSGDLPKLRFAAQHEGFNLHAGVHIAAGDDMGRERLFRYGPGRRSHSIASVVFRTDASPTASSTLGPVVPSIGSWSRWSYSRDRHLRFTPMAHDQYALVDNPLCLDGLADQDIQSRIRECVATLNPENEIAILRLEDDRVARALRAATLSLKDDLSAKRHWR